jgi:hypothetical protein
MISERAFSRCVADGSRRGGGRLAPDRPNAPSPLRRGRLMWTMWVVATLAGASVIVTSQEIGEPSAIKASITMIPLLALTALFVRWLGPVPLQSDAGATTTRKRHLALLVVAVTVPLLATGLLGLAVLGIVAVAAGIATWAWRADVRHREVLVALGLAVLAALGGSATWLATEDTNKLLFALSMLPLVTLSLLAGWAAARRGGWHRTGVGRTLLLTDGRIAALKASGLGALLGLPWALGNVSNGPGTDDPMKTFLALHQGPRVIARPMCWPMIGLAPDTRGVSVRRATCR